MSSIKTEIEGMLKAGNINLVDRQEGGAGWTGGRSWSAVDENLGWEGGGGGG